MATDARGHTVPAASDVPSRNTLLTMMLSVRDIMPVTNTTTRASAATAISPSTANPLIVYRADARPDSAIEVTPDGSTYRSVPLASVLTAWTPTVTSGLTVGNGVWTGAWQQEGQWVDAWFSLVLGSTTSVTGTVLLQLPVPPSTVLSLLATIGQATYSDSSAGATVGRVSGSVGIQTSVAPGSMEFLGGNGTVNATMPFTWAVNDILSANVRYQAA